MLDSEKLEGVPILILANFYDLHAISVNEIAEIFQLDNITDR